jgi:hypothetical protein
MNKCEALTLRGKKCQHEGIWLVQMGERVSDGQLSCASHLGLVCSAFAEAEGRRASMVITVRRRPHD